jgi:uncharacterized protein GlcG (DUF336 family)
MHAFAATASGQILGQVALDSQVLDSTGSCNNLVQLDGSVLSRRGLRVGKAQAGLAVHDAAGCLSGVITEQGAALSLSGAPMAAKLEDTGMLRRLDGSLLGNVVVPTPIKQAVVRWNHDIPMACDHIWNILICCAYL